MFSGVTVCIVLIENYFIKEVASFGEREEEHKKGSDYPKCSFERKP
jgi:hypothetical protein